jgi:hypothetical protein
MNKLPQNRTLICTFIALASGFFGAYAGGQLAGLPTPNSVKTGGASYLAYTGLQASLQSFGDARIVHARQHDWLVDWGNFRRFYRWG